MVPGWVRFSRLASNISALISNRLGSAAVIDLERDIVWHRQQIHLAGQALREADKPSNPTRAIEVEALLSTIARLERTLVDLEKLRPAGDNR